MSVSDTITAVIPVKPWALSKSRIVVDDASRESLARAFALDVMDAVMASAHVGQVVLVTAEPELRSVARRVGAVVLPDRPLLSADALNTAIDSGRRWAMNQRPASPVVVIPADLPAMTTAVLEHTLDQLSRYPMAFVPDASGLGTSILGVRSAQTLHTSYGKLSAERHVASGYQAVDGVDVRARLDVDTREDLVEARLLGVGHHTSAVVDALLTRSGRA